MRFRKIVVGRDLKMSTFFLFSSILQAVLLAIWRAYDFMMGFAGYQGFYFSFLFICFLYATIYLVLEMSYIKVCRRGVLVVNYFLSIFFSFFLVYCFFKFFGGAFPSLQVL